ncbi:neprosin family prolyl endopeptidase [Actinoplanes sp. NPDC051861]|uniref:neprosin family prolyl endopeptidase n=1 Tax=Actinoplanes sp. NPDC051861 TaxID=3155170 RepID=UPI00342A7370
MLKSRRGLLAAGLTVAVVSTLGVVSTLNAGAEQIPDVPAPAEAAVAPEEPAAAAPADVQPPALLPWGEKPRSLRIGRNGANSRSLKAAGLSAAPDSFSESRSSRRDAPKGQSSRTRSLRSERTDVVPPVPPSPAPSATSSADGRPDVYFHYNVGAQAAVADGAYANITISKPKLDKADYHSLTELAVRTADEKQTIEVGWTVDRSLNGDDDPHLFVYHWVDGKKTCYNECGFVPWTYIKPGATLPQDTQKRFGIQWAGDAWWVAYDTDWVGYFPGEIWGGKFTKSGLVQVFGEVAAATEKPCSTQMGNGKDLEDKTASRVGSLAYLNGPEPDMYVYRTFEVYPVSKLSPRTFRYGGPGECDKPKPTPTPTP